MALTSPPENLLTTHVVKVYIDLSYADPVSGIRLYFLTRAGDAARKARCEMIHHRLNRYEKNCHSFLPVVGQDVPDVQASGIL